MPKNALIFSPRFDGHRQVYVFVIAQILNELGFRIYIAGNTQQILQNSFYYIEKIKEKNEITFIDTGKFAKGGFDITIQEFLQIQDKIKTDLTIFPEADRHLYFFISQIFNQKNKLRGRTVGIFMRPFYFYQEGLGIIDKLKYLKHLPSRLKKDESLFYEFFLKRFSLLNVSLCIDENFVRHHQYLEWLPDMFQQYAESIIKNEKYEERKWIEKLDNFTKKNRGRFIFLYFGTSQHRRGYDILLNLAEKTDGCFIHCGLKDENAQYDFDTNHLRTSLNRDGRLFETDEYITDPVTIQYFFKSTTHLILPYRRYFGSSGVMLQALGLEIPVLSPDNGIIGYRITNHNLGLTYNEIDMESLIRQFNIFRNTNPQFFKKTIAEYMNYQTVEQLKNVLVNSFTNKKERIIVPLLQNA